MRRGYTLIEIIVTVAITGILAVGMFKAFEAITLRSEKAKTLTLLSIDSQSALDQIGTLLYNRAPLSVQGCDTAGHCEPLEGSLYTKTILAWYGLASESYAAGDYSGFVDMAASARPHLSSPGTDLSRVLSTQQKKWGATFAYSDLGLIFAGSFDEGGANAHPLIPSPSGSLTLSGTLPDTIYEKYYLADSAYAVTRKEHAPCTGLDRYDDTDLLLFYDYRPWKTPAQTMCDGKVALLSKNVNAFRAQGVNGTIRLSIDMHRPARGGNPVRLSKQKVVF